jgi:putative membrane protein
MKAIPRWAAGYLREEDRSLIKERGEAASRKTGVVFAPVVVRRSSPTGHVAMTIAFMLLFAIYFIRFYAPSSPDLAWVPWYYPVLESLFAIALAWALAQWPWMQRLFVPARDQREGVERRARLEFYKHHIEENPGGEGILLFVSLMERRCLVLAGRRLGERLPPLVWHEANKHLLEGAKKGRLGEGYLRAIEDSEKALLKHGIKKGRRVFKGEERLIVKE